MIDVKKLTKSQRMALETMKHFDCKGIWCDDCPFNLQFRCGSQLAGDILDQYKQYKKETKQ